MGWEAAVRIELNDAERSEPQARARRRKIARADAMRAEIVLLAADGMTNLAIAERLGITRVTVATWRGRFAAGRLDGLVDEPRPGAPRRIGDEKIAEVVTTTLETMPAAATHWSTRSMAKATGVSVSTVHRIWRAFSLQPQRSETFELSTDPLFVEKVHGPAPGFAISHRRRAPARDIVGLYLDPPERPAGSHLMAWCGDPHVDHGRKRSWRRGDHSRDLTPSGPLRKPGLCIGAGGCSVVH